MDDKDIITLFQLRSEKAIDELSKKYGRLCMYIADNILHNKDDSEECVNDVWLKTWNSIPPAEPTYLRAYISKAIRNFAIDRFRYNSCGKRSAELDLLLSELNDCIPAPESDSCSSDEAMCVINRFLETNDAEIKVLFIRRYFAGESVKSLAQRFEMNESNVTTKLWRARKKLKFMLESEGINI